MSWKNLKPIFDSILALITILAVLPIFLILTIALLFNNQGSPFFYQIRTGINKKHFKIIKFKTMNDKKDEHGNLLSDKFRLTKFGKFLRKTSLDELPQLINVIKGDMSLVGPRPLLPEYLPLYSEFQNQRHLVKPGITGWAQINGRNAISWQHKFELDVWYVNNISFVLDIKILFLTLAKVIKKDGINSVGQITTTPFTGNS